MQPRRRPYIVNGQITWIVDNEQSRHRNASLDDDGDAAADDDDGAGAGTGAFAGAGAARTTRGGGASPATSASAALATSARRSLPGISFLAAVVVAIKIAGPQWGIWIVILSIAATAS